MKKMLIFALIVCSLIAGYHAGIHHAMTDSTVSVYLDGVVEIQLDGNIYQHEAF